VGCAFFAEGLTSLAVVRLGVCSGGAEVRWVEALAGVPASLEVGVRVFIEVERVVSFLDVELDEFAGGVVVDHDCCAVQAAAPEEHDMAARCVTAGELLWVRIEGKAIAIHLCLLCDESVGDSRCQMLSSIPFASVVCQQATAPGHALANVVVVLGQTSVKSGRHSPGPLVRD
jgi:hypothetical protein